MWQYCAQAVGCGGRGRRGGLILSNDRDGCHERDRADHRRRRQLSAAGVAYRPGQSGEPAATQGARARDLAHPARASGRGAGGGDAGRDPGPGARGRRRHQRRRDQARELFQPGRHRARRHRQGAERHAHGSHRQSRAGPPRLRADPARAPHRGGRRQVPARQHGAHDQDHAARPLHHDPAGGERLLPGRREPRHGLRRRGERGDQGPLRRRRRHRAARRALRAGPARGRARLRGEGDQPGAGGRRRARPRCTSASATRP